MSDVLLILWVTLIGADRIDFAGGNGPFILTPFLALTPLVVVSELIRRGRTHQRIAVSRPAIGYAALAGLLICVALTSVFAAPELPTSASRAFLLTGDVVGTFAVALLCRDRPNVTRLFARGALLSLPLFLAFDVAEALFWIGRGPSTLRLGPILVQLGSLQNAGPIPRLAGPVDDANRAGFVLLFFLLLIAAGESRTWLRRTGITLGIAFLVATLSRSATLAATAMLIASVVTGRTRVTPRWALIGGMLVIVAASVFLMYPRLSDAVSAALVSPAAARLSVNEGSAQSHVALIERGLDEATASIPRVIFGLGYGTSYLVLQDVFPGNRYGNFHSLYVTMFAEAGIVALLVSLILLVWPIVRGGPWQTILIAAVVFNIFYQTTTEPAFWFVLAAAWIALPLSAAGGAEPGNEQGASGLASAA